MYVFAHFPPIASPTTVYDGHLEPRQGKTFKYKSDNFQVTVPFYQNTDTKFSVLRGRENDVHIVLIRMVPAVCVVEIKSDIKMTQRVGAV